MILSHKKSNIVREFIVKIDDSWNDEKAKEEAIEKAKKMVAPGDFEWSAFRITFNEHGIYWWVS